MAPFFSANNDFCVCVFFLPQNRLIYFRPDSLEGSALSVTHSWIKERNEEGGEETGKKEGKRERMKRGGKDRRGNEGGWTILHCEIPRITLMSDGKGSDVGYTYAVLQ